MTQVALHPMLNVAIKAARAAGSIINRASLDLDILKINTKSPNDFVTEVDQAAENAIIEILLQAYPDHGILAEESGREHGAASEGTQSLSELRALDRVSMACQSSAIWWSWPEALSIKPRKAWDSGSSLCVTP